MKKVITLLLIITLILTAFSITVFADDSDDSGNPQGPPDKEEKAADRMARWLENKARIEEKKAALAARKEAFFVLKEQTKLQVAEEKALIKEQKAFIIEQIHLINELEPHERKQLKKEIKELWGIVRDTQKYLWEIRQAAGEQAREILGKVEVIESSDSEIPNVDNILGEI